VVKALEKSSVAYADIQPTFLTPADARAAFEKGAVDAWAIWDPFLAAAEAATGARQLTDCNGLVVNHQFYFGTKTLVSGQGKVVDALLEELASVDAWAKGDIKAVAAQLSPSVGIPANVLEVALARQTYGIKGFPTDPIDQ
jgi:sulfonate transport system substrate-binding protein